jgi:hypothetical protein
MFDYSDAPSQREMDLIPHGTIVELQMIIQPGGAGEDGLLKRSADGLCEMLSVECIVVSGKYFRRKLWERFVLAGTSDGHAKAAEISRSKLRAILESAKGIKPDDTSPQARAARSVALRDFDNMRFIAKVGIEKGKDRGDGTNYPDRNTLLQITTPDRKDWRKVEQVAQPPQSASASAAANAPVAIAKPAWAS